MTARYSFKETDKKIDLVAKFDSHVTRNDITVEMDKDSIRVMRKDAMEPVIEVSTLSSLKSFLGHFGRLC